MKAVTFVLSLFFVTNLLYTQTITIFEDNFEQGDFKIFPNPSNGRIHITNATPATKARVYDLLGRLLASPIVENNQIDLSDLGPGVFILKLSMGQESIAHKIIIK